MRYWICMCVLHANIHYISVLLKRKQAYLLFTWDAVVFLSLTQCSYTKAVASKEQDVTVRFKSYLYSNRSNKRFLVKIHKASKALSTVRIAKSSPQYFGIFSIRSAAGTQIDKIFKLCTYSETCPKRSLDTAQSCL